MGYANVAIVIPAFNEAQTIDVAITKCRKYGEVFIVDDASVDGTRELCLKADCRLITNDKNLGYAGSLKKGIEAALDFDYVITIDADGEIPFRCIEKVIAKLGEGDDLVLGVRDYVPRYGEKIVNHVSRLFFNVEDIFCGLKGYRTDRVLSLKKFEHSIGTSLALSMLRQRCRVGSVSVTVSAREDESRFGDNGIKTNLRLLSVLKFFFSSVQKY